MKTRAEKTKELLGYIERGPALDLTFVSLDVPGLSLTPEHRLLLEASLRERYRVWSQSWPQPLLQELLARELKSPNPKVRRPRGMGDLLQKENER